MIPVLKEEKEQRLQTMGKQSYHLDAVNIFDASPDLVVRKALSRCRL
jgi:hypothetical protein